MEYKERVFEIPMFACKITVATGNPMSLFDEEEEYPTNYDAFVTDGGEGHLIVYFADDLDRSNIPSVVSHECIHLKNLILKRMSHILNYDNDEVEAYLVGHLVKNVTKRLRDMLANILADDIEIGQDLQNDREYYRIPCKGGVIAISIGLDEIRVDDGEWLPDSMLSLNFLYDILSNRKRESSEDIYKGIKKEL